MFGSESKNKKSDHNIQNFMINRGYQSEKKIYVSDKQKNNVLGSGSDPEKNFPSFLGYLTTKTTSTTSAL